MDQFEEELDNIRRRAGIIVEGKRLIQAATALSLLVSALTAMPVTAPDAQAGQDLMRPLGALEFYVANPGFLKIGLPQKADIDPQLLAQAQQKLLRADYEKESGNTWKVSWKGDCEDLSLAVYQWLVDKGVPKEAMRIVARPPTSQREGHAVLCIWTPEGPICLDILKKKPTPMSKLGGKWYDAITAERYY